MAATAITASDLKGLFATGTFTLDPASIAANTTQAEDADIPEAKVGDIVICTPRTTLTAGSAVVYSYVDAAGSAKVVLVNTTASAIDLASGTWDYCLIRGVSGLPFAG